MSKEMVPEIEGMVIAADGGDDPVVVKKSDRGSAGIIRSGGA